jgi:hypothetical protein
LPVTFVSNGIPKIRNKILKKVEFWAKKIPPGRESDGKMGVEDAIEPIPIAKSTFQI